MCVSERQREREGMQFSWSRWSFFLLLFTFLFHIELVLFCLKFLMPIIFFQRLNIFIFCRIGWVCHYPWNIYLLKVNNRRTRKTFSKLQIKTPERVINALSSTLINFNPLRPALIYPHPLVPIFTKNQPTFIQIQTYYHWFVAKTSQILPNPIHFFVKISLHSHPFSPNSSHSDVISCTCHKTS